MKYKVTVYKGELRSQFKTTELAEIGNGKLNYAHFQLEPRFRLFNAVKHFENIEENLKNTDYLQLPDKILKHYQDGPFEIELYNSNEPKDGRRVLVKDLMFYVDVSKSTQGEITKNRLPYTYWKELEQLDKQTDTFYRTFLSNLEKEKAGKIIGEALIRIVEEIPEESKDPGPIPNPPLACGCLSLFMPNISNGNNCFNKYLFLNRLNNDKSLPGGCFPLFFPGGNWGFNLFRRLFPSFGLPSNGVPGCGSAGCGCLSLLLLLAIPLLLMKTCNNDSDNGSTPPPITKIIHDTVYKEVFKEKIDTLTIIKRDTISLIDSTTITTVEMVKLPNVQFYTDADILLPSSAKELQKLAEYLIENPNLKATIIGHTDNTGDSKDNLELSKRRAESVKNFLVQLGVKKSRLKCIGMGDTNPAGDNNNEEGRLMNRRVEVQLTQIGKIETVRTNKD